MKTIYEHVSSGISNIDELKDALQLAMQLEFSTIPPYLAAQWSIEIDPDKTEAVLHRIVNQEMYHFALAGNLLKAIGGVPKCGYPEFLPSYPADFLPGGIPQAIPVDIRPLDNLQLEVFMQIEHPAFVPIAFAGPPPATIGEFYDAIITAFRTIMPAIDQNANTFPVPHFARIKNLADAIKTIELIKAEGEGLQDSPDQPTGDERSILAHYYLFKEIFVGKKLTFNSNEWKFDGAEIRRPQVNSWTKQDLNHPQSTKFRDTLSNLLIDLEAAWRDGSTPNIAAMFQLRLVGQDLISAGICPPFVWKQV